MSPILNAAGEVHTPDTPLGTPAFDAYQARKDFPVLDQLVHGHPLVYLDNADTTQ